MILCESYFDLIFRDKMFISSERLIDRFMTIIDLCEQCGVQ